MSADQATVFNQDQTQGQDSGTETTNNSQEPSANPQDYTQILTQIQEEGRQKYSDIETALKSIAPAQEHISNLERELNELRAKVQEQDTAEALLAKLKDTNTATEQPSQAEFDPDVVQSLVEKTLAQREAATVAKANVDKVKNTLSTKFGDKAEAIYIAAAQASGMSIDGMNKLSATAPEAVLKLAGVTPQGSTTLSKTESTINTDAFVSTNSTGEQISAKVPTGATTKDMTAAWHNAGKLINKEG